MTVEHEIYDIPHIEYADLPIATDRAVGWTTLRDAGAVVLGDGAYYLTRREDVLAALRNPEIYSSKSAFDILGSPLPLVPLAFDPTEHTRFRKILQPFFSPHTLGAMLPSLQAQAIEMVRLEPPAPIVPRVTTQEVEIAGFAIPAGARVWLCLAAINRDGSDATSGDDLVMDGKVHKHWGFGGGTHRFSVRTWPGSSSIWLSPNGCAA